MVFIFTATATFVDFHRHRTGNHVARSQVFHSRRITLHKTFAIRIQQDAALTTYTFGNQYPRTCHAGRMELPELHIFQRNTCTRANTQTVTGIHKGVGRRSVNTACTSGSKQHCFGMENINIACFHFHHSYADYITIFITDQIQRSPLNKKLCIGTNILLIQSMQHCMACTVGNRTSTFYGTLAVLGSMTAERTLINFTAFHAVERHAHVLQFNYCFRRSTAHKFDRILVAQPVRTFHGIVHMPIPTVFLHITERCGNTALCRYSMRTGRKYL